MTEKIRDYNVNGAMIIGVDNGYGNMKTARRCFKTALVRYDSKPVLSRDYLEYEGKFYVIGEGHKGFVVDKQSDEDNYILTLAAIAKELEARGMKDAVNTARVHLAVGLPLKWVQAQKEDFKSLNAFVIIAIDDYYERHLKIKADSYFETREKEDAFAERMVQMVEQKVLANLPALVGMYQMQQSMLMAGLIGTQQGKGMVYPYPMTAVPTATVQQEQSSTKEETNEPEENEFLDYSFGW